ncbi:MAG: ABC transporter ATP-binding protein [Myxococcota bacterium]
MASAAKIEIDGLTKRYRDFTAIEEVSFSVKKGEIVGFLGPNGAGKSTTMRILTGFMPASSGVAKVAGFDVSESPREVKRRVGYLPEVPPVYPDLTVTEYLRFVARLKGLRGADRESAVEKVCEQVGLGDVRKRLIRNLSKGYQQRTGLAQALLGAPEVLILDEPTVGLDPRQIGEVRELIRGLAGEHTVVLSTHILQEVTATCERVVIINRGRIVANDSQSALLKKHAGKKLEEVFLELTEN